MMQCAGGTRSKWSINTRSKENGTWSVHITADPAQEVTGDVIGFRFVELPMSVLVHTMKYFSLCTLL